MNHPITPPPELVYEWANSCPFEISETDYGYEQAIAEAAAKWAADQQLEAVERYLDRYNTWARVDIDELHEAMRPKAQTLNERARSELALALAEGLITPDSAAIIRIALEEVDHD
jgi:hypothetical protein